MIINILASYNPDNCLTVKPQIIIIFFFNYNENRTVVMSNTNTSFNWCLERREWLASRSSRTCAFLNLYSCTPVTCNWRLIYWVSMWHKYYPYSVSLKNLRWIEIVKRNYSFNLFQINFLCYTNLLYFSWTVRFDWTHISSAVCLIMGKLKFL